MCLEAPSCSRFGKHKIKWNIWIVIVMISVLLACWINDNLDIQVKMHYLSLYQQLLSHFYNVSDKKLKHQKKKKKRMWMTVLRSNNCRCLSAATCICTHMPVQLSLTHTRHTQWRSVMKSWGPVRHIRVHLALNMVTDWYWRDMFQISLGNESEKDVWNSGSNKRLSS